VEAVRVQLDNGSRGGGLGRVGGRVLRFMQHSLVARLTAVAIVAIVWQWGLPQFGRSIVPPLGHIFREMWNQAREGIVFQQFGISLSRLGVGFVLTMLLGIALGIGLGKSRLFEAAMHDFTVIGVTFPYLITALLVAMWVGFNNIGPVIVMVVAAVPYIALNVSQGVKAVDKKLVDMARSYEVSAGQSYRHVIFPSIYPFLFAAVRLAVSVGWRALIMGEVFAATSGAGYTISGYWRLNQRASLVAMGLYFAVFAVVMERIFAATQRRVFRWRPSSVAVRAARID
jgi:ABC-type nitrate/sulfonate/bicarbonate transport system permease component